MYKIKVNDGYTVDLSGSNGTLQLNGEDLPVDVREIRAGHLHLIYKHKSYAAEIVSQENGNKQAVVKINGRLYQVNIEDQYDTLLKAMGLSAVADKITKEIKAPMPGLVLGIHIHEGQAISKGDSLLVLEAMKMENMLKSSTEGIVKKIWVSQGDKVEKNQILVTFE